MRTRRRHPTGKKGTPLRRGERAGSALLLSALALLLLLPVLALQPASGQSLSLDRSLVTVQTPTPQGGFRKMGSGVVVGDGLVVTNHHVVKGVARVKVVNGGVGVRGRVVAASRWPDLAFLRIPGSYFQSVDLGAPPHPGVGSPSSPSPAASAG